jgi:hypothetical protein
MSGDRSSLLLVILALCGFAVGRAPAPAPSPSGGTQARADEPPTSPSECASDEPCFPAVFDQFLGKKLGSEQLRKAVRANRDMTLDYIVATVPDPVDSSVAYMFDRFVDSIQRAAEAAGFVRDRYWFPWAPPTTGKGDAPHAGVDRHEREPGVILFRRERNKPDDKTTRPQLLAVFLVGETPTFGVHKQALSEALKYVRKSGNRAPIRILGPAFSGSIFSMRSVLESFRKGTERYCFQIISGSATLFENQDALKPPKADECDSSFSATVLPDSSTQHYFYRHLVETMKVRINPVAPCVLDDVAILGEGNTQYGSAIVKAKSEEGAPKPVEHTECAGERYEPRLRFSFPSNIAQLRAAYERKRQDDEKAEHATRLPKSNVGISLSLDRESEPKDALPMFSRTSINSDNLVLSNLLNTISREGIRWVGLAATDTSDMLFLAYMIRRYCPDVRLFTFASDILFADNDYAQYFEGMTVVSSYPLSGTTALHVPKAPSRSLQQFSSSSAEGVYNAAVVFMRQDILTTDKPSLQDYSFTQDHKESLGPAAWISVVSNGALWPVGNHVVDDADARSYVHVPSDIELRPTTTFKAPEVRQSALWVVGFLIASVLCLGCSLSYLMITVSPEEPAGDGWWATAIRESRKYLDFAVPCRAAPYEHTQRWLLLAFFGGATLSYAAMAAVAVLPGVLRPDVWGWLVGGLALVVMVSLLTALFLMIARWTNAAPARALPVCLGIALALVGAAAGFYFVQVARDPYPPLLAYDRFSRFGSGLSPLAPLLALGAAICLWLVSQLRRFQLLDTFVGNPASSVTRLAEKRPWVKEVVQHAARTVGGAQPIEPLDDDDAPGAGVTDAELGLRRTLEWPLITPVRWVLFGLLIFFPLLHLLRRPLIPIEADNLLEGYVGGALFTACLYALCVLIALTLLWLVWSSIEFRRFLRRLARHPIASAFDRMTPPFSKTLAMQLAAQVPLLTDLRAPLRQLRVLARDPESADSGLNERMVDAIEQELANDIRSARTEKERLDYSRSSVPRLLFVASWLLMRALEKRWLQRRLDEPAASHAESWRMTAEDFVATQLVVFISQLFSHLRNFLTFLTVSLLLLLFAVRSYPFQPGRLLMVLVWIVGLTVVSTSLILFVQLDRDEVLSRIGKTVPGQVSWDRTFVSRVFVYGALPLLGLVAAEFPAIGNALFSWLDPLLQVLH